MTFSARYGADSHITGELAESEGMEGAAKSKTSIEVFEITPSDYNVTPEGVKFCGKYFT